MNIVLKRATLSSQCILKTRSISSTLSLNTKQWRISRGLPVNKMSEGVLTDGPDYTFLDGRPTPLLQKQKLRLMKQQQNAERIVDLCEELEFAKKRYQSMLNAKEEERQNILNDRLKPKGKALSRKKLS